MPKRLTYDQARALLPAVEDVRPILDALLRASRPDPARAWSAAGELDTLGSRLVEGDAVHRELATALERTRDRLESLYGHLASALERAGSGDASGAALALLRAAELEERAGRAGPAAAFAEVAYRALDADPDRPERGRALRRWARARRTDGRLADALRLYGRARDVARAIEDLPGWAEAAIGGGNVLEQMGRWSDAEASYREALGVLGRITPESPAHWHAPLNIHIVLRSRGALEESRSWLERSGAIANRLGDEDSRVFLENARGQLLMAEDDPAGAEHTYQVALAAARGPFASVTVRLNLAESLLRLGRTLDAAEQARTAERDAIAGSATFKLPEVYRLLGRIAGADGRADAFVLFERSLELAGTDEGSLLERAMTLQAYAEAERTDPDAARALLEEAHVLYRQLGITHARRRWADCFDAEPTNPPATAFSTHEDPHA